MKGPKGREIGGFERGTAFFTFGLAVFLMFLRNLGVSRCSRTAKPAEQSRPANALVMFRFADDNSNMGFDSFIVSIRWFQYVL